MKIWRAGLALLVCLTAQRVAAQSQDDAYLPLATAAERLIDGRPWAAILPQGPRAEITLLPDGTGRFRGPLSLSLKWRAEGENLCLDIRIAGTKCLRFREVEGGLQGWADGKPDLTLTR